MKKKLTRTTIAHWKNWCHALSSLSMCGAAHPQREVEDARAELVRLATGHFPELPRLHPDIFEVVSELKDAGLVVDRTIAMCVPPPRHARPSRAGSGRSKPPRDFPRRYPLNRILESDF